MDNARFSLRNGRAGLGVLRFSTLLVLGLIATGCCTVVANSGDAKILTCPQLFIHSRDSKMFRMVLPTVSLAKASTHVIQVRDLPIYLEGLFEYSLSMSGPYEGPGPHLSDTNAPWHNARISVAFRKLDGTEVFKQQFHLGVSTHSFGPGRDGWEAGWNLGAGPYNIDPVPVKDESFDIVVTVEQPSLKSTDKIALTAFAVYRKKP